MEIFDASAILLNQGVISTQIQETKPIRSTRKKIPSRKLAAKAVKTPSKAAEDPESEKCRLCLANVEQSAQKRLTKAVETSFYEVTQKNLHESEKLSRVLCKKCEKELKQAAGYRKKLLSVQTQLESQLPQEAIENVVVKCEVKDEADVNQDGTQDDDFSLSLFDSTQILDQFENDVWVAELKPPKVKQPKPKTTDKRVICPECGLMYASKMSLKKHIAYVHIRIKKFVCDYCGYSSTNKYSINVHIKIHIDPERRRVHNCDKCSFVSVSANSLKRHKEYEHSGIKYECTCGKKFKQKGSLQLHVKHVHEKKSDYNCECGRKFYKKVDLEDHMKIAHDPKKKRDVQCDKCERSFYTRKQLTRHLEYHKEMQYKCKYCEKAYHTEFKLKRHTKTHEGNRDLICHICNAAYFFNRDLQCHLDVVHKQTVFFCELCPFTNSRKDYLGNHLRSAHHINDVKERKEILMRAKFIRNNV